jgi:hypothetical protein
MFGLSVEFLDKVVFWATVVTAITGGIAVTSGFIAGIVGYQLAKQSDLRIAEAEARTAEAELKLEDLRRQVGPRKVNRNAFLARSRDS